MIAAPAQHPRPVAGDDRDDRDRGAVLLLPRWLVVLVVLLAATISASAVLLSSRAAFTASLENGDNSLRTSTVTLTANVASALFDVSGMAPGDTEQRCVEVTYAGTLVTPTAVRLHVGGMSDPAGLADHLGMTVLQGGPGTRCGRAPVGTVVLDETLATAAARSRDHASGAGSWVPVGPEETRPYVITLSLDRRTPSRLSGARIDDLELVWEVTS